MLCVIVYSLWTTNASYMDSRGCPILGAGWGWCWPAPGVPKICACAWLLTNCPRFAEANISDALYKRDNPTSTRNTLLY